VRGIIGFRLTIRRLEGKWKMGQNRPLADRLGMAQGLEAEGKSDGAALIGPFLRLAGSRSGGPGPRMPKRCAGLCGKPTRAGYRSLDAHQRQCNAEADAAIAEKAGKGGQRLSI
jgi:hypothetical protein